MTKRLCRQCHVWKPVTEFHRRADRGDGILRTCRSCTAPARKVRAARHYVKHGAAIRARVRRRYHENPTLVLDREKEIRKANPDRFRGYELKSHYKLTNEDYAQKLQAQKGRCAVCGDSVAAGDKPLEVDHDHSCCPGLRTCGDCLRGLVCGRCNRAMGLLRDNPAIAGALAKYLRKWGART
jgi:hypothetical protein